jgi:hypothetical protein
MPDKSVDSLEHRIKKYLLLSKDSQNNANANSSNIKGSSICDTILSVRTGMLEAPSLYGGAISIPKNDIGSFRPSGEAWGGAPHEKKIFSLKKVINFSFDPENMCCNSCPVEHRVLEPLGGGGGGSVSSAPEPVVFVLADQAFPAALVPGPGGGCVGVVQLECGSINELVNLFLDVTRGCSIPAGSVLLVGSLSHLADTGLSAYASDLNDAAARIDRIFQGGIVVLPGLLIPPGEVNDPVLTKDLFDVLSWSKRVAKVVRGGQTVMDSCFEELVGLLTRAGTGGGQAAYGGRHRLPLELGSLTMVKWDTRGQTGLPTGVCPLPTSAIIDVLNKLSNDLHRALGTRNFNVAGLYGASKQFKLGKNIVVIGASHAKRLNSVFKEAGEKTTFIETPSFRLLQKDVAAMTDTIQDELGDNLADKVLLINAFDNSYFVAKTEDGHFIPPRKDSSGRYHVDGEISCAPLETAKQMLINSFPLLRKFAAIPKIILVPIPRYLYAPCCSDIEHVPNMESENHVEKLLEGLDATHRLWRGMLFREKIPNVKVCNVGKAIAEKALWGSDPVHPSPDGYNVVSKFVLRGFASMLETKPVETTDGDVEEVQGAKRRLEDDGGQVGIPKRPFWVLRNDDFVTRRDENRGSNFRGRSGNGGGGRGRWPRRGGFWPGGNRGGSGKM